MGLFKINLIPIKKTIPWEVSQVKSGRKEKTCEICGETIKIGESSITFMKKELIGLLSKFTSRYCHNGDCYNKLSTKISEEDEVSDQN